MSKATHLAANANHRYRRAPAAAVQGQTYFLGVVTRLYIGVYKIGLLWCNFCSVCLYRHDTLKYASGKEVLFDLLRTFSGISTLEW